MSDAERRALAHKMHAEEQTAGAFANTSASSHGVAKFESRLMLDVALDATAPGAADGQRVRLLVAPRRKAKTTTLALVVAAELLTYPDARVHFVGTGKRACAQFVQHVQRLCAAQNAACETASRLTAICGAMLDTVALLAIPYQELVVVDEIGLVDAAHRDVLLHKATLSTTSHAMIHAVSSAATDNLQRYTHVSLTQSGEERLAAARAAGIVC